jgi:hypothetical protein
MYHGLEEFQVVNHHFQSQFKWKWYMCCYSQFKDRVVDHHDFVIKLDNILLSVWRKWVFVLSNVGEVKEHIMVWRRLLSMKVVCVLLFSI